MTLQEVYVYAINSYKKLLCRIRDLENGVTPADGNGIYSGDGNVADNRTVNLLGLLNILGAGVGRQFYVEIGDAVENLTQIDMTSTEMEIGHINSSNDSTLTFNEDGITANYFFNIITYTPSSAGDTAGVPGSMCYDSNFLYIKTANHVWERVGISPIP